MPIQQKLTHPVLLFSVFFGHGSNYLLFYHPGEIGFLKEDRRINVAVTRARRHLFVVGDSSTISRHPFLESFCTFMFEKAVVRSMLVIEQLDSGAVGGDVIETSTAAVRVFVISLCFVTTFK